MNTGITKYRTKGGEEAVVKKVGSAEMEVRGERDHSSMVGEGAVVVEKEDRKKERERGAHRGTHKGNVSPYSLA